MGMGKGQAARGSARAVACICWIMASLAGVSAWGQQALQFVQDAPGFSAAMSYQNFGNGEHINIGTGGLTVVHPSAIRNEREAPEELKDYQQDRAQQVPGVTRVGVLRQNMR